jgi:hypothetical protein
MTLLSRARFYSSRPDMKGFVRMASSQLRAANNALTNAAFLSPATARARPWRLRAIIVSDSESLKLSGLYGTFVWRRRVRNSPKWWFPARAGGRSGRQRGVRRTGRAGEKDAKLAQLGQLQSFIAVFRREYIGQLAYFGPTY